MQWDEKQNPTMALDTLIGSKIRFTGKGGYDSENERANRMLVVGESYTLESIDVGGWRSEVHLKEIPGARFNSVMFQNQV
ncbi:hypothetical protein [Cohnella sp. 56]|uniref:hypothetical protein n=1 Tax=Cohnella sp. 56 TaxID=3113722 RepID=UPI0030E91A7C